MQIREVMSPNVEVVRSDATLQEVASRMKMLDVGMMPVSDGDRLVGMVTDRDITIRAVAEGRNPTTTTAREVMTPETIYCLEDQDVTEASRLMQEKQIRRLLILNHDKRLVGVVSLGDLAVKTGGDKTSAEALQHVSEPAHPIQ